METKFIEFQFSDGTWRIPAHIIARDRASYYAEHDTGATAGDDFQEAYQQEFTYTMGDDYELTDWLRNNMNWEDVERDAFKVKEAPTVPYAKQWQKVSSSGDMKIVIVSGGEVQS